MSKTMVINESDFDKYTNHVSKITLAWGCELRIIFMKAFVESLESEYSREQILEGYKNWLETMEQEYAVLKTDEILSIPPKVKTKTTLSPFVSTIILTALTFLFCQIFYNLILRIVH